MTEAAGASWRRDIEVAYELFATKHVDNLTSRQLLEAALDAMRSRAQATVAKPAFTDVADIVAEDRARLSAAIDDLLRERPDVSTDDLRDGAIEAMVGLRPDGHTRFWPVWANAPVRDIAEGRCEIRFELLAGRIGLVWWSGWVRAEKFDIVNEIQSRLEPLLGLGAKGWLFDIRGNHGGAGARQVASLFLDGQPLWRVTHRDGRNEVVSADRSLRLPAEYQLPIAIAVDSESWSASEMFAFGLQQHRRATIVGERTAGYVGSVDGTKLSGDSRVGVNSARVTGPNGETYNGVGVKPDIETKSAEAIEAACQRLRELLVSPA